MISEKHRKDFNLVLFDPLSKRVTIKSFYAVTYPDDEQQMNHVSRPNFNGI